MNLFYGRVFVYEDVLLVNSFNLKFEYYETDS